MRWDTILFAIILKGRKNDYKRTSHRDHGKSK